MPQLSDLANLEAFIGIVTARVAAHHPFPPVIIQHTIRLYLRLALLSGCRGVPG